MNYTRLNKKNINTTKIKFSGNVPYISYNALENISWLYHGFSTRKGGVSTGYLESMNLGHGRDDLEENIIKNHEIMARAIGFNPKNIVTGKQTHTTNIRVVSKNDAGKGIYKDKDYDDIDGMVTNEKNIILTTYFADCVPLYIVDTKNKAIGLSHSGWKGTVGRIGKLTIEEMNKQYGSKTEDLVVCIGPSICQSCYEISEDVALEFKKEFSQYVDEILINKGNSKYMLDLWKCNKIIFMECGVIEENINLPDICTCCNHDILFSHRATAGKRGNMAAFLGIKTV